MICHQSGQKRCENFFRLWPLLRLAHLISTLHGFFSGAHWNCTPTWNRKSCFSSRTKTNRKKTAQNFVPSNRNEFKKKKQSGIAYCIIRFPYHWSHYLIDLVAANGRLSCKMMLPFILIRSMMLLNSHWQRCSSCVYYIRFRKLCVHLVIYIV